MTCYYTRRDNCAVCGLIGRTVLTDACLQIGEILHQFFIVIKKFLPLLDLLVAIFFFIMTSAHYIGKIVCVVVNGNFADSGNVDEDTCDAGYEFARGNDNGISNGE